MPQIRLNPLRASMAPMKPALGERMPGQQVQRGLGGTHFASPEFIQQGHNRNTIKSGAYKGKSNALGHGGRAQQLRDQGVPGGVIGAIARRKGAAPGQRNYHGK